MPSLRGNWFNSDHYSLHVIASILQDRVTDPSGIQPVAPRDAKWCRIAGKNIRKFRDPLWRNISSAFDDREILCTVHNEEIYKR